MTKGRRAQVSGRSGLRRGGAMAVDIRRDVVYLVYIEGKANRPCSAVFRREPIDASLYSENPLEAAAAAVARITHGLDLRRVPVTLLLPNDREALRIKRFPWMKKTSLASAARIAMRTGSLLGEKDAEFHHFVQRERRGPNDERVLETVLLEVGCAAIADAREVAQLAGLNLTRVSSPGLALGRALRAVGDAAGTVLVVDLFGPATTINVYTDGHFLLSREADVSADLLSGEIGDIMSIAEELARPMETGGGIVDLDTAPIALDDADAKPPLRVSAEKLQTEIVRSNRYVRSQHKTSIEKVYLAGSSREATRLMPQLERGLGLAVALLEPSAVVAAERLEGAPSASFVRCLGGALELLAPARARDYQLLAAGSRKKLNAAVPFAAVVALCVLGIGAWFGLLRARNARADARIMELRQELARVTEELTIPGSRLDPDRVEARLSTYRLLRSAEPQWSDPLHALAASIPEGIWLTRVELASGDGDELPALEEILAGYGDTDRPGDGASAAQSRLMVYGRAVSLSAVPVFLERLEAAELLHDARIVSLISPDENENRGERVFSSAGSHDGHYQFVLSLVPDLRGRTDRVFH